MTTRRRPHFQAAKHEYVILPHEAQRFLGRANENAPLHTLSQAILTEYRKCGTGSEYGVLGNTGSILRFDPQSS